MPSHAKPCWLQQYGPGSTMSMRTKARAEHTRHRWAACMHCATWVSHHEKCSYVVSRNPFRSCGSATDPPSGTPNELRISLATAAAARRRCLAPWYTSEPRGCLVLEPCVGAPRGGDWARLGCAGEVDREREREWRACRMGVRPAVRVSQGSLGAASALGMHTGPGGRPEQRQTKQSKSNVDVGARVGLGLLRGLGEGAACP